MNCQLASLSFLNLRITGDLLVVSRPNGYLELSYKSVVCVGHALLNSLSSSLDATLENSSFSNSGLDLYAETHTSVTVVGCDFTAWTNEQVDSDNFPRVELLDESRISESGLHLLNDGSGDHVLRVWDSKFIGHRSKFKAVKPMAALTLHNEEIEKTQIMVSITRCTFSNNSRGVDLSLIGKTQVSNCL